MIREEAMHLTYRYAAGRTGSRFLAALRDEGVILASRCPSCGRVLCPARGFCARCGEATGEPMAVGPEGRLLCSTAAPGRGAWGLVQLDGADTALLHRLLGDPGSWCPGARMRARFAAERQGAITDLAGFEPVEESRP